MGRQRGAAVVLALALPLVGPVPARGDNVLAQISVPSGTGTHAFYNELYVFPEQVRDYSDDRLYGYGFRQARGDTAFREVQLARVRTPSAYLMVTDFFANGRFSSMSHTVLFVFPRPGGPGESIYEVRETPAGDVLVHGPDGSALHVDGRSGAVLQTRGFRFAPPGAPGTPPRVSHRGFSLRIQSVGKSPFLRGTPVVATDFRGRRCTLRTEDLFLYDGGPESDRLRFTTDRALFEFLDDRCPRLATPALPDRVKRPVPVLEPERTPAGDDRPENVVAEGRERSTPDKGRQRRSFAGAIPYVLSLLSR